MAKGEHKQSREDRLKIAARIVELSDQVLSTKENKDYIALQVGDRPNCNAVIVSDSDYVKFLIRSPDVVNRAKTEGFAPVETKWKGEFRGGWRFWGLGVYDLQAHGELFRAIVRESVSTMMDRRSGKVSTPYA